MDDTERTAIRDEGYDPDDPEVVAALERVRAKLAGDSRNGAATESTEADVETVAIYSKKVTTAGKTIGVSSRLLSLSPCKAGIQVRPVGVESIGDGPNAPVPANSPGGTMKCSACKHTTTDAHAVALPLGAGAPTFCPSCPVCQAEQKREPEDN